MFPSFPGGNYPAKIFNDPIHGHIEVPLYCLNIIDTPQFQRLRDLKQLGSVYFIFPGASHNRFEHSIGVGHLAESFVNRLRTKQPELEISNMDVRNITVGGLIHDIGHGPFSHSFEKWILSYRPELNFHHEEMSIKMFRHLIDENSLEYEEEDVRFISELVSGLYSVYVLGNCKISLFGCKKKQRESLDVRDRLKRKEFR
eukprot:TRINITY_DN26185_c0_g1_i1.p1 TRINITY_DN26185_c0_g1~~TRINITY_DN26185_c0_g1_i1.p1  ORF type:complete len:213 (-),score=36.78 TRINITY_DN26185_c0_g1_i1:218-817(-)